MRGQIPSDAFVLEVACVMGKCLAPEMVARFDRDGILFPISVLAPTEVTKFRSAFDEWEARLGGKVGKERLHQTHLHFLWAYALATQPKVLDVVEDLLGPDILVWATSVFPKYPHDPTYISWHQDGTYWNLDSTQIVSAWIALTDSTVENGCMRVVPGSHKNDYLKHIDTYAKENLLSRGQEIAVDVDENDATAVVLKAGEMSLHHVRIIHGSTANGSNTERVGFAVRYTVPAVRQMGEGWPVVLARGQDNYGYFEVLETPPSHDLEQGLAAQAESARKLLAAVTDRR